jgi:hypothetical protein
MVERRLELFQWRVADDDAAAGGSARRLFVKHESGFYRVCLLELGGSAHHDVSPACTTARELLTWIQGLEEGWGLADHLRVWDEQDIARNAGAGRLSDYECMVRGPGEEA